jgi:hypothetical protein
LEHNHNHEKPASLTTLIFAILINGGIVVAREIYKIVRQIGAARKLLSAHLRMTEEASDSETVIRTAQEMLLHKYGINHTTLQILTVSAGKMAHCNHCN